MDRKEQNSPNRPVFTHQGAVAHQPKSSLDKGTARGNRPPRSPLRSEASDPFSRPRRETSRRKTPWNQRNQATKRSNCRGSRWGRISPAAAPPPTQALREATQEARVLSGIVVLKHVRVRSLGTTFPTITLMTPIGVGEAMGT